MQRWWIDQIKIKTKYLFEESIESIFYTTFQYKLLKDNDNKLYSNFKFYNKNDEGEWSLPQTTQILIKEFNKAYDIKATTLFDKE